MYVVSEPPDVFDFNPRSREGSDIPRFNLILRFGLISIHAPVKGATYAARLMSGNHLISIHAPVKGATVRSSISTFRTSHFNPRSREGSDCGQHCLSPRHRYFNPRSREGSDPKPSGKSCHASGISIHAPVKGATRARPTAERPTTFQSTLP